MPADIQVFPAEEQRQDKEASLSLSEPIPSLDVSYMEEIMLPSADLEKQESGEEEGRATILLVDDNKEMVDYLKNNFKSEYITLIAGSGEEALEMMKEQKVDLILSDVMMPGIDGIKLCEIVKKNMQTCHIPVILLSAKGSLEAQTAGIQAGADDYIPKPFSMYLLKGKINNILKARQRLRYYYSSTIDIDAAKMTSNKLDEEFITKAIQTVEENISDEDFTADDLAEKLFMSRSSLYYKMNSISGEPPANFIRRIRFNMACKLLLDGHYSISEVSAMVGFASRSYFSTSFKKYMGCLPSDYEFNAWIVKPADFDPSKKYPVMMTQYSGPNSQQVLDQYGFDWEQYLASNGIIVVCVDGRGTGARGEAFRKCTYLRMGELESRDQVEAAQALGKLPYIDKDRIAIWGWSFGGYNTLMVLSTGNGTFKVGIAVAPPTDWKYYDSVYTERFMRTPQENFEGYAATSPLRRVKDLQGKLLLVHGTADDNVHFMQTMEYAEALVQAGKQFDMHVYKDRNHSIYGGNTRYHLYTKMANYLFNNL